MKDYESTEIAYKNGYEKGLKDAAKHGTGGLKKHKCDTCQYKGEHQEMGFRAVGVCTLEKNLLKAMLAYKAPECPFAVKKETQHGKQMRLIDADALLKEFERRQEQQISNYCDCFLNDAQELSTEWSCVEDIVENAPTIEAIPIDVVAEMLAELFGDECCCNYNDIDEWLPMLCEHSETCPETIEKNGCWKQLIKHWRNNA